MIFVDSTVTDSCPRQPGGQASPTPPSWPLPCRHSRMRLNTLHRRIQIMLATSASAISNLVSCTGLRVQSVVSHAAVELRVSGIRHNADARTRPATTRRGVSSVKARLGRHGLHPEDTSSDLGGCRICTLSIKMHTKILSLSGCCRVDLHPRVGLGVCSHGERRRSTARLGSAQGFICEPLAADQP